MDTACAVAVDMNVIASEDERCMVVLEGDGVAIVTPIIEVR